jgi:hypothetical protein
MHKFDTSRKGEKWLFDEYTRLKFRKNVKNKGHSANEQMGKEYHNIKVKENVKN